MPAAKPKRYYSEYKFIVRIDGFVRAAFQDCSELEASVEVTDYYEGGTVMPEKIPQTVKFNDCTLQRGATDDMDAHTWFEEVVNALADSGVPEREFRRQVEIVQQDRNGAEIESWILHEAFPKTYGTGKWDNKSNEVRIEKLVLAYKFFTRKRAT